MSVSNENCSSVAHVLWQQYNFYTDTHATAMELLRLKPMALLFISIEHNMPVFSYAITNIVQRHFAFDLTLSHSLSISFPLSLPSSLSAWALIFWTWKLQFPWAIFINVVLKIQVKLIRRGFYKMVSSFIAISPNAAVIKWKKLTDSSHSLFLSIKSHFLWDFWNV